MKVIFLLVLLSLTLYFADKLYQESNLDFSSYSEYLKKQNNLEDSQIDKQINSVEIFEINSNNNNNNREITPNSRVLVNSRFVGKVEENAKVISISEKGSAYIVKEGTILVDNMLIEVKDGNYKLLRIDDKQKSVNY